MKNIKEWIITHKELCNKINRTIYLLLIAFVLALMILNFIEKNIVIALWQLTAVLWFIYGLAEERRAKHAIRLVMSMEKIATEALEELAVINHVLKDMGIVIVKQKVKKKLVN